MHVLHTCVCVCVRACLRACAFVQACVYALVHACVVHVLVRVCLQSCVCASLPGNSDRILSQQWVVCMHAILYHHVLCISPCLSIFLAMNFFKTERIFSHLLTYRPPPCSNGPAFVFMCHKRCAIGLYREYAIAIQDKVGDSNRGNV